MVDLLKSYKKQHSDFDTANYHKVLETTLAKFTEDDITKHGCLADYVMRLSAVCYPTSLSKTASALFYAKELSILRKVNASEIAANIMQKLPDQNEIAAIIKMRDDNVNLSWISYYIRGDKRLVQQLSTLTEALTEEPNLTYSA